MDKLSPKSYRRIVTGHRAGKAVVLNDTELATYAFKNILGFEHTYVWTADGVHEADPSTFANAAAHTSSLSSLTLPANCRALAQTTGALD